MVDNAVCRGGRAGERRVRVSVWGVGVAEGGGKGGWGVAAIGRLPGHPRAAGVAGGSRAPAGAGAARAVGMGGQGRCGSQQGGRGGGGRRLPPSTGLATDCGGSAVAGWYPRREAWGGDPLSTRRRRQGVAARRAVLLTPVFFGYLFGFPVRLGPLRASHPVFLSNRRARRCSGTASPASWTIGMRGCGPRRPLPPLLRHRRRRRRRRRLEGGGRCAPYEKLILCPHVSFFFCSFKVQRGRGGKVGGRGGGGAVERAPHVDRRRAAVGRAVPTAGRGRSGPHGGSGLPRGRGGAAVPATSCWPVALVRGAVPSGRLV